MQVNADFFEYLKINNLFFNRRYYYSFEPSPHHYNTHTWTLGKEFRVLLLFFSATAGISCLFVHFSVSEFDLTLDTFMDLQLYNGVLSVVYIPIFRYFIHNRLTPTQPMRYAKRTAPEKSIVSSPAVEITENPDEQQARKA